MYRLRHCPVPELLAFDEATKIRVITAGFTLLLAAAFVFAVDRQEIIEISRAAEQRAALRLRAHSLERHRNPSRKLARLKRVSILSATIGIRFMRAKWNKGK